MDCLIAYCNNPTKSNFDKLNPNIRNQLIETAIRIKNKMEFIDTTINYSKKKTLPYNKKRGIQSLLVAIKYMNEIKSQLPKSIFLKYSIVSYDNANTKITIKWDNELEMYQVIEKSSDMIPKELSLYFDYLIEYIKDYYIEKNDNVIIKKINLYKPSEATSKPIKNAFYRYNIGTIFRQEECIQCRKLFSELLNCIDDDCKTDEIRRKLKKLLIKYHPDKNKSSTADKTYKKLYNCKKKMLEEMCYKNIRHRPE